MGLMNRPINATANPATEIARADRSVVNQGSHFKRRDFRELQAAAIANRAVRTDGQTAVRNCNIRRRTVGGPRCSWLIPCASYAAGSAGRRPIGAMTEHDILGRPPRKMRLGG